MLIGADRIAANGDTANKIGSYSLALAAREARVPFLVVAPESTIDVATLDGAGIEIEERDAGEVTSFHGVRSAPVEARTLNPAFDVTPPRSSPPSSPTGASSGRTAREAPTPA